MTNSKWDWRKQQWLLHQHDNHKFQSVYTPREQPVFEANETQTLADMIVLVSCGAVLGIFVLCVVFKLLDPSWSV
jgi:hypothetical protein